MTGRVKKTAYKAPEPLPRRLRTLLNPSQEFPSRDPKLWGHRRTARCHPLIDIVRKAPESLQTNFPARRIWRYRRGSQAEETTRSVVGSQRILAARVESKIRIRACLQACRQCRVMNAPLGAGFGRASFTTGCVRDNSMRVGLFVDGPCPASHCQPEN